MFFTSLLSNSENGLQCVERSPLDLNIRSIRPRCQIRELYDNSTVLRFFLLIYLLVQILHFIKVLFLRIGYMDSKEVDQELVKRQIQKTLPVVAKETRSILIWSRYLLKIGLFFPVHSLLRYFESRSQQLGRNGQLPCFIIT